ncbi:DBR1-domain-containing protein [Abortiporus biennis]|nr:DBR1-domain-containing protein [Abortiporus biennis]
MKIAVEGCAHGALSSIYDQIHTLESKNGYKVDLLLICGDFQAMRNESDLQCMAVPDKYRQLGEFWKYYTGKETAPLLTIIIGGNHEASNYFWELYHGGWIAPNMYFLGHAGCIQVNGIRIAGASGIFKGQDFSLGHFERLPYNAGSMRSIYHIREFNIRRLSLLSSPTIFLSHDWPVHITAHGDLPSLLRRKPYFKRDIQEGNLGSPPLWGLLGTLKPDWWFAAHLHCRFEAEVTHEEFIEGRSDQAKEVKVDNPDEIVIDDDDFEGAGEVKAASETIQDTVPPVPSNPDEIRLDDEEEDVAPPPPPLPARIVKVTKFLALDKCLPKRQFLEVIDIPTPSTTETSAPTTPILTFDPEWLAITRAFNTFFSSNRSQLPYPDEPTARAMVAQQLEWVLKNVGTDKRVTDVQVFEEVAPGPSNEKEQGRNKQQPPYYPNPQTAAFCKMLDIENKVDAGRIRSP